MAQHHSCCLAHIFVYDLNIPTSSGECCVSLLLFAFKFLFLHLRSCNQIVKTSLCLLIKFQHSIWVVSKLECSRPRYAMCEEGWGTQGVWFILFARVWWMGQWEQWKVVIVEIGKRKWKWANKFVTSWKQTPYPCHYNAKLKENECTQVILCKICNNKVPSIASLAPKGDSDTSQKTFLETSIPLTNKTTHRAVPIWWSPILLTRY